MGSGLLEFLKKIQAKQLGNLDEISTKQTIILPILGHLGWDQSELDEIYPEYGVGGQRVDYAINCKSDNKVFIEAKRVNEDLDNHQRQLLNYAFSEGVKLAILTNGTTWWFYLPLQPVKWEQRKFYAIEIYNQTIEEIEKKLLDLISKENVASGQYFQNAEKIYRSKLKTKRIEETMPKVWERIIKEPDESLVDLIAEATERSCGYRPDMDKVKSFLADYLKKSEKPVYVPSVPKKDLAKPYEKGRRKDLNYFGHKIGTQAAMVDDLLLEGTTVREAARLIDSTEGRVRSHIRHLRRDKGFEVVKEGEVHKIKMDAKQYMDWQASYHVASLRSCKNFDDLKSFLQKSTVPTNYLDRLTLEPHTFEVLLKSMAEYRKERPSYKDMQTISKIRNHIQHREKNGWIYQRDGETIQLIDYQPIGAK